MTRPVVIEQVVFIMNISELWAKASFRCTGAAMLRKVRSRLFEPYGFGGHIEILRIEKRQDQGEITARCGCIWRDNKNVACGAGVLEAKGGKVTSYCGRCPSRSSNQ